MRMNKRWILKTPSIPDPKTLRTIDCHPLVISLLAARGYAGEADIRRFLSPLLGDMYNPSEMRDMDAAVVRLLNARAIGETVCVYGDYDVDGITATSLLTSFLRLTGFKCHYFIPNRFRDGYGLSIKPLERIIDDGSSLIISVDCGITAIEEALFCRARGADLIIVDHHAPNPEIPKACAVLNPLRPGCGYPFKSLAGVGVAFNLLVALRAALRDGNVIEASQLPDLRQYLDLVALGTIADMVPLTDQNRIYAAHGLKALSDSARVGVRALKHVAAVNGSVGSGQVGFRLAPRLNAAGRMESAALGVDLLLSDDYDESLSIAAELDAVNEKRRALEDAVFEEAAEMADNPERRSIVLASETWHQGVIGIVASRLVERFHRPTILVSVDENGLGRGSGRGIPGFHMFEALTNCSSLLNRFGGHQYAAGLVISKDKIGDFTSAFEAEASCVLQDDDLCPRLEIDLEVGAEDVTLALLKDLKRMEPFGMGNPEPVFMMRAMTLTQRRVVGGNHLKLKLSGNGRIFDAIAFRMAERYFPEKVDVAFTPEINLWNGTESLQLRIRDFRPSE